MSKQEERNKAGRFLLLEVELWKQKDNSWLLAHGLETLAIDAYSYFAQYLNGLLNDSHLIKNGDETYKPLTENVMSNSNEVNEYLSKNGIKFKIVLKETDAIDTDWSKWKHDVHRWTFTRNRNSITGIFHTGIGLRGNEVTSRDILQCFFDDARAVEYENFNGFCNEFGYNPDSRQAHKIYLACERIAKKLDRFFTPEEQREIEDLVSED